MLSTIPSVKLQSSGGSLPPSHVSSSTTAVTSASTSIHSVISRPGSSPLAHDHCKLGPFPSDMSRRKQRNPKPLVAPSESEGDLEESEEAKESRLDILRFSEENDDSADSPHAQDLSGMVKVEVREESSPERRHSRSDEGGVSPRGHLPFTPSPPGLQGPMMRVAQSSPLTTQATKSLRTREFPEGSPPPPPHGSGPMAGMEEFFAKNNMFHFGDVIVGNHPDAPPVPMVVPMVYLVPILSKDGGKPELRYRMFVPLNGQEPHHPQFPPHLLQMPPMPIHTVPGPSQCNTSSAEPRSRSNSSTRLKSPQRGSQRHEAVSRKRKTSDSSDYSQSRRECTTPLDLSKSPKSEMGDEMIAADEQDENLKPHAKRVKNRSPASDRSRTSPSLPGLALPQDPLMQTKQSEIEAHLNFLRVKHLEFLKSQQQQQAVASESRCDECNINFSKHQNYIAHKKYYCSSGSGTSSSSNANASSSTTNGKVGNGGGVASKSLLSSSEMDHAKGAQPSSPMNNGSAKVDGRSSVKSQSSGRSLPPPSPVPHHALPPLANMSAAAALELLSMTSEAGNLGKDMLLLKQQHEMLMKNDANPTLPIGLLGRDLLLPPQAAGLIPASVAQSRPQASSPNSAQASRTSPSAASSPLGPASAAAGLSHFVCEGCGIKFKSVTNLQAHKARYCAGLRKSEEINAFEAMMKRAQLPPQPQFPLAVSAAEMMSFLNAKSLEQQAKMAAAAAAQAAAVAVASSRAENGSRDNSSGGSVSPGSTLASIANAGVGQDDFCCILCGFKERSVDRLKEHINMHFIGQIKRQQPKEDPLDVEKTTKVAQGRRSASPANSTQGGGDALGAHLPQSDDHSPGSPKSEANSSWLPKKQKAINDDEHDIVKEENSDEDSTSSATRRRIKKNQVPPFSNDKDASQLSGLTKETPPHPKRLKREKSHEEDEPPLAAQGDANQSVGQKVATGPDVPPPLKCEPCDIGFSHPSNYLAHKKYYCRGQRLTESVDNE